MFLKLNLLNVRKVLSLIAYNFLYLLSKVAGCVPADFIKLNYFVNIFHKKSYNMEQTFR